eukprot:scaffold134519_cov18-Prasinocladus_malaysianus.AAC.1
MTQCSSRPMESPVCSNKLWKAESAFLALQPGSWPGIPHQASYRLSLRHSARDKWNMLGLTRYKMIHDCVFSHDLRSKQA